jgi:hypothetical protein
LADNLAFLWINGWSGAQIATRNLSTDVSAERHNHFVVTFDDESPIPSSIAVGPTDGHVALVDGELENTDSVGLSSRADHGRACNSHGLKIVARRRNLNENRVCWHASGVARD